MKDAKKPDYIRLCSPSGKLISRKLAEYVVSKMESLIARDVQPVMQADYRKHARKIVGRLTRGVYGDLAKQRARKRGVPAFARNKDGTVNRTKLSLYLALVELQSFRDSRWYEANHQANLAQSLRQIHL